MKSGESTVYDTPNDGETEDKAVVVEDSENQMEDEIANGKEIHKSEAADVSFLVFITSVTKIRIIH